jgi:chromosomal replication initiation ATPase DnaA
MVAQLPLDLGHRPALGREDFLVAECNAAAVAWVDRWPDWPGGGLAIHGSAGCGKTHLAEVWRRQSGAIRIAADTIAAAEPPSLVGAARACVIDSLYDDPNARPDERRLLHLYNLMRERGGQVLLAAQHAPARWPIRLPDLKSRLAALPAVEIGPPDDTLLAAVLVKLFADRQLAVGTEVIAYLAQRMERSFETARRIVAALDREALAAHRRVALPLAREVLAREFPDTADLFDDAKHKPLD